MIEMYLFKDNVNSVVIDLSLVDIANEIEKIATDVGCEVVPDIIDENRVRLLFVHKNLSTCKFMTYLAQKYIEHVTELNKLITEDKQEELDLSGLNIVDNTEKYKIPM